MGVGDGGLVESSDAGGRLLAEGSSEEILEDHTTEVGVSILGTREFREILPGGMIVKRSEIDVLPHLFHGSASWGWDHRRRRREG